MRTMIRMHAAQTARRFWISDALDELLKQIEQASAQSRSQCLRNIFGHYLYGTHGGGQIARGQGAPGLGRRPIAHAAASVM